MNIKDTFKEYYLEILHTGSRAICPTAVTSESDDDYVLLVHPGVYDNLRVRLQDEGWGLGGSGSDINPDGFNSWKKEINGVVVNLIITMDQDFFRGWMQATSLAKSLNLTNKSDRVTIFDAMLYDNWPDNLND